MIKKFIECGEIVGTHGVRGEVRVNPWCDSPEFLRQFKVFYLDENGERAVTVERARAANTVALIKIQGINSKEDADKLRRTVLYINRNDADIGDRYFVQELIGATVYDADSNKVLGEISDVTNNPANDIWHIKTEKGVHLLPAVDAVIVSVDVAASKAVIRPMKGIFDDED